MLPFDGLWIVLWSMMIFIGAVVGGIVGWRDAQPRVEDPAWSDYCVVTLYVIGGSILGGVFYAAFPIVLFFSLAAGLFFGCAAAIRLAHRRFARGDS